MIGALPFVYLLGVCLPLDVSFPLLFGWREEGEGDLPLGVLGCLPSWGTSSPSLWCAGSFFPLF